MKKVRPADSLPVMPHVETPKVIDPEWLKGLLAREEKRRKPLEEWARGQPERVVAAVTGTSVNFKMIAGFLGLSDSELIEAFRGVLLDFQIALAQAEEMEVYLSTKQ